MRAWLFGIPPDPARRLTDHVQPYRTSFSRLRLPGVGLGALADSSAGGVDGVPYLQFVVPGILAMQAMMTAFGESTYAVMGYIKWNQMYAAMLATPLRVVEVRRLGDDLVRTGSQQVTGTESQARPATLECHTIGHGLDRDLHAALEIALA